MRARLLTAVIGIPLFLAAAVAGGVWWLLLIGLITLLGLAEWHGLIRKYLNMTIPLDALFGGGLLIIVVAYNISGGGGGPETMAFSEFGATAELAAAPAYRTAGDFRRIPGFGPGAVLFPIVVYTVAREALSGRRRPIAAAGAAVLGVVYVAGLLAHLLLLRGLGPQDGLMLTLLAIVGTWLTDTGAFFTGRALGGRRLVPALSPHKTVSGAIGGWVIGFVGLLTGGVLFAAIPLPRALLLAGSVPVAAQLGDLLESAMKREAGIKDTGRLLPGHGGILDRFDSLLLVAPTVYYITVLL